MKSGLKKHLRGKTGASSYMIEKAGESEKEVKSWVFMQ